MNGAKGTKPYRILAISATLFGVMVTTWLLPAYGQQEVDPTWYNPWPEPRVVVHSSQPRGAIHQHQPTIGSVSSSRPVGKFRERQPASRPRSSRTLLARKAQARPLTAQFKKER